MSETSNPSGNADSDPNPNEPAVDATAEGSRVRMSGGARTSCPYPANSRNMKNGSKGMTATSSQ